MSDIKRYEITWREVTFKPVIRVEVDFEKFNIEEALQLLVSFGFFKDTRLITINDIEEVAKLLIRAIAWGLFYNFLKEARNTKEANTLLRKIRLRKSNNTTGKFEDIGIHFVSTSNWGNDYLSNVMVIESEDW